MKTAFPPLPEGTKEVDWDFELTKEEEEFDKMEFERMPNTGPKREAHLKKLMEVDPESGPIPSFKDKDIEQKEIVQIPKSIFKQFQQVMKKAKIPYSVI